MSGHPQLEVLALWAGGDLEGSASLDVGMHLDSCAECRGSVEEIRRTQDFLRGAFEEPSEADLQLVRYGVAGRLVLQGRTARWCWSLVSSAAGLVLVAAIVMHRNAPVPAVAEPAIQLPAWYVPVHPALEIPELSRAERPPAQRAHALEDAGLRAVNFVARPDGSTQLRLTTADPNVVILLPPTERTVEQ